MEEIWKDIPELNGKYQCSNFGRIRRVHKDQRCKPFRYFKLQENKEGYLSANPTRTYRKPVHRIVALLFIPNPENKPCVNHKDFNPKNNRVDNLEWCTYKENNDYSRDRGRFKPYGVKLINTDTNEVYLNMTYASKALNCNYKYLAKNIKKKGYYKNIKVYDKAL